MTELIVATYNLRDGGIDECDPARMNDQLALLAAHRPHAAVVCEAKGWTDKGARRFHQAEQALGMRGFLVGSNHHGCHLVLFVRESAGLCVVEQRHDQSGYWWHCLARLVLYSPHHRRPLWLLGAHLAPAAPRIRAVEAEMLQLHLPMSDPADVVLAGDFNAAPAVPDETGQHGAKEKVQRKLDRTPARIIDGYELAGGLRLADAAAAIGDSTPTTGSSSDSGYTGRTDRIYSTLTTVGYRVDADHDALSDHRLVVARLRLEAGDGR